MKTVLWGKSDMASKWFCTNMTVHTGIVAHWWIAKHQRSDNATSRRSLSLLHQSCGQAWSHSTYWSSTNRWYCATAQILWGIPINGREMNCRFTATAVKHFYHQQLTDGCNCLRMKSCSDHREADPLDIWKSPLLPWHAALIPPAKVQMSQKAWYHVNDRMSNAEAID